MSGQGEKENAGKREKFHAAFGLRLDCRIKSKRFDDVMVDEQAIAASILIPKFKNHWTDDQVKLQKGKTVLS